MSKDETTSEGRTLYGWCMTGEHDSGTSRGACPVQVATLKPCGCPCHRGAVEPRGFLDAPRRVSPSSPDPVEESPEASSGALSVVPVEGEQIPLL